MKKILLLLLLSQLIYAQKHDYNWITGYGGDKGTKEDEYGLTQTNFSEENAKSEYVKSSLYMDATATTISDKEGNLLFYTNGIEIYNKLHKPMKNSENFNVSKYNNEWKKNGLVLPQGILALPVPSDDNKYYLLYPKIRLDNAKKVPYASGINYAIVDMKGDQNLGEVVLKDIPIINDTLNYNGLTACKHGNGRDWWIITPSWESNRYHRMFLSPKGLILLPSQVIGDTIRSALSQVCFSPDGKKYARNGLKYTYEPAEFDLYDFDRCQGLLSNHKRIKYTVGKTYAVGISFSYDNSMVYTVSRNRLVQWDLRAKDLALSVDTVAYYDGYIEDNIPQLQATFYMSQLAPDGKIYLNSSNSTKHLHIIHKPNKKGKACQVQQHGFRLKSRNGFTLPNHPNYRLGPLDGSPCDTLGIDNTPVALFRYDQDTLNTTFVEFTDLSHHEPANWEWDFGDGTPKSKLQEPNHLFSKKGEYNVCLTVSNKYGKHTACKKVVINGTTATNEPDFDKNISIYPNPISDILNIENLDNQTITITDVLGKTMLTEKIIAGKNSINLSDFPNGTYILKVGNATCKIIKI